MVDSAVLKLSVDSQVHTYKISHGYLHSVWTLMISRVTSVFTYPPRRVQCVLHQVCIPLPMVDFAQTVVSSILFQAIIVLGGKKGVEN